MSILIPLSLAKKHINCTFDDDDEIIQLYIDVAIESVKKHCNQGWLDLDYTLSGNTEYIDYAFPKPVKQAILLLTANLYANKEPVSHGTPVKVPYTYDYLLEKYINYGESVISGTSGTSGTSGESVTSGSSGTSGIDGISGTSGTSGTSGVSGTSGSSGVSGISDSISVKDFGALGDNSTDDTTALESAFDYAFTNKKAVYFPSGTYLTSRSLILKSKMEVYGQNATIKKIAAVTATTTASTPENQGYVTVDSVTGFVVGRQIFIADTGGARYCTNGIIDSIDTENKRIYFTSLHNSIKVGAIRTHVSGTKVSTSFAILRTISAYYECVGAYIHNLTLDGNRQSTEPSEWTNGCIHIDPVATELFGITYTYTQSNNTFRDLTIFNSPCDGISDQGNGGAIVDGCNIYNTYKHGVHFGTTYLNAKVNNCSFTSTGLSGSSGSGVFWCQFAEDIIVTNNNFKDCYRGCSSVDFSTPPINSIISNNIFRNITNVVLDFSHTATGSTYGGLVIDGNIVIQLRNNFVKVGYLDSIVISNNIIRSITTAPSYLIIATSVNGLVVTNNLSVTNTNYVDSTNALKVVNANNTWNV